MLCFCREGAQSLEACSNLDSAEAIKWRLESGVLNDYLKLHGSEAVNMLLTEFNLEDALNVRHEEETEHATMKC
jgi:hypothetical protein